MKSISYTTNRILAQCNTLMFFINRRLEFSNKIIGNEMKFGVFLIKLMERRKFLNAKSQNN